MAAKDDTVAQWLHNKLGSTTHLWSFSSTVVSQYSLEKLHSIKDCFCTLDSLVKLKFFLSLFYIPKRCIEEFKPVIEEIIENTIQSCLDQWVLSVAMFVQTFWLTQSLDTQYDYDLESFKDVLNDLQKILKKSIENESGCERSRFLLPMEIDYLNREARFNIFPTMSTFTNEFLFSLTSDDNDLFTKHFTLFKPPRAYYKLDELKNKASHYSKSKTTKSIINPGLNSFADYSDGVSNNSYTSSRFAKRNDLADSMLAADSYSSRSFSTAASGSSSFFKRSMLTNAPTTTITGKSSTPKRNVGIKLLDAQEQSVTPKEAKRKRKEQEKEIMKKQKQQQDQQAKQDSDEIEQSVVKQESLIKTDETGGIPGLPTINASYPEETPSYFNQHTIPTSSSSVDHSNINNLSESYKMNEAQKMLNQQKNQAHSDLVSYSTNSDYLNPKHPGQAFINTNLGSNQSNSNNQSISSINDLLFQPNQQQIGLSNQTFSSNLQSFQENFNRNPLPNFITQQMNQQLDVKTIQQQNQQLQQQQHNLYMSNIKQQQTPPSLKLETFSTTSSIGSIVPPTFTKSLPFMNMPVENERAAPSNQFQNQMNPQEQNHQRQQQQQQSLSLTREQMLQAQEMFSSSDRLSRPDKAQILGFIAGSRDNPCPDKGSLIAIKLNEAEEIISSANGQQHRVVGELYFEMNYDTGEYKKIKKFKNILN